MKLIQRSLKQLQVESNKRDARLYANMFAREAKVSSMAAKVKYKSSSLIIKVLFGYKSKSYFTVVTWFKSIFFF